MKQKLLKTWLMLVCLLVGAGTTWATDESITLADGVGTGSGTSYSITWSGTSCDITQTKENSSNNVNSSYISAPRWYQNHKIAFKAKSGYTLTGATIECTTNDYATALKNSTFSNGASATSSAAIVTITTSGDFNITMGAQSRIKSIKISYTSTGGGSTPTKYNVNIANNIANGTVTASSTSAASGAEITLTATPATGYEFGSWSVTNASTSAAITVTNNKFTMPAANVNVSATFNKTQGGGEEPSGDGTWVKCSISDLTSSDIFVIVDANSGTAMTNNNGTSSAPTASAVTVSEDGNTITGVTAVMKWNISGNASDGYTIYPNGTTKTWLYCTNTNNGVRVGTNAAKTFTLDGNHLKHAGTSRYVGVYNSQDWRCYTSKTGNIENTDTKFYKYVAEGGDTPAGDPKISNFIKTSTLSLETGAEACDVSTLLSIPADYTGTITTTINGLTQKDGEFACVYPYLSFQKAGTYTVTVTAAAVPGKYAETSGTITVTVKEPVAKTLTSITVSGTPTKKEYYDGDVFNTAGLVVKGTYSDSHTEVITEGITWTINPKTLTLGTTSVSVVASVGEVKSNTFTIEGLTVTESLYKTASITSFSATSGDINDDIAYEALQGEASTAPAVNNNNLRLYQNGGYVTVSAATGLKIASVKITTSATYASTTVGYCVDDEDAPTEGETVAKSSDYTISGLDNSSVSIYCLGTDKNTRLEIAAIEVKYSGNAVTTLKNITLSGTYPTEFNKGDEFSHEGMTVTANYTDGSDADVTSSATFTGCDMNTLGEQTVTVSYTEDEITKTAEYTINVVKAPFVPTPAAEGYEIFDIASLYSSVTTNATVEDCEGTSFAMAFAKPDGSSTPTKYYDNGKAVRAYTDNTITITAAEPIDKVNMAWVNGYVDDAVSITGLGTTTAVVTFNKNCRFTGIVVSYKNYTRSLTNAWGTICLPYDFEGDATTTYYSITSVQKNESGDPEAMALTKETELKAGVPYIFCSSNTGAGLTCTATGTNGAVKPATVNGMTGSFTKHAIDAGMYLLSGNKFVKVAAGSTVGANRAYIKMSAVPTSSSVKADVIFGFDGEITDGIFAVEGNERHDTQYFDLSGRRVMNPTKGLYIANGKKVMVK
ncbi:MAG: bacterial Ig-like domain-containing protein [Bacteroidaceae bacterium]|nr:bacterial Ig-like domain-containing protein [Bacteroidaceae bacterium]